MRPERFTILDKRAEKFESILMYKEETQCCDDLI